MPGESTRGTKSPLRFDFNPSNGTLTRHDGDVRFSFRAHPPQARVRSRRNPRWLIDEAPDLLDFPDILRCVEHRRSAQEQGCEAPDPDAEALSRFLDQIPPPVQDELRVFPSRSWRMFNLLHCVPAALELTQTNRALSFALANASDFTQLQIAAPLAVARTWAGRRRHEITELLGFETHRSVVRILSRVVPASIDIIVLLWLRRALRNEEIRARLGHLERINRSVVALAVNPFAWRWISPQFVDEVSAAGDLDARDRRLEKTLHDTVEMMVALERRTTKFSSLDKLLDTHRELVQEFAKRPPPADDELAVLPLPGIPGIIEPLRTARELWREGVSQKNCVAAPHYAKQVKTGSLYVYRLLSPERCTLSIRRSNNKWVISELKRAYNRKASKAAWRWVGAWLKNDGKPPEAPTEPIPQPSSARKPLPAVPGRTQLFLRFD